MKIATILLIVFCCGCGGSKAHTPPRADAAPAKPKQPDSLPIKVSVASARLQQQFVFQDHNLVLTGKKYTEIVIDLENTSDTAKYSFAPWSRSASAILRDNFGNTYKAVDFDKLVDQSDQSIYPHKKGEDILAFEPPVDGAALTLQLPRSNFGGADRDTFDITLEVVPPPKGAITEAEYRTQIKQKMDESLKQLDERTEKTKALIQKNKEAATPIKPPKAP